MRKHGWQLPYHPLQVVAVSVFLALGFAFYVFFAPFVGKKLFQYIVMGIYTPLIMAVFGLYIRCAAADPADPGVLKSRKYLKIPDHRKHAQGKDFKLGIESSSSIHDGEKTFVKTKEAQAAAADQPSQSEAKFGGPSRLPVCFSVLLPLLPCASKCCSNGHEESSDRHASEEGMFYCSLCEVEVFKYSKHCRVCDKCVDRFDHHCRWLNNCVGKSNYRKFFTLMVSALLLLILQWSIGILVMFLCFVEKKRFATDIPSKLGSSFSMAPFVMVVGVCTILAMLATLPLAQLFFFHILLIKKGLSTYDYIMALREQEQQGIGGNQSPQLSTVSSITGLSSVSSFNTFHRASWCTPPRLLLEDQYDVAPPHHDNGSVSSFGKKTVGVGEEATKKKHPNAVKISPWTLARMNTEDISKAAAEARKKSKILHPVARQQQQKPHYGLDDEDDENAPNNYSLRHPRLESNNRTPPQSKRVRVPPETSMSLAPLHFEPFHTNPRRGSVSSSDSSVEPSSPDIPHPFRGASAGMITAAAAPKEISFSRSTSDGYEASGGEDSDRVPGRFAGRLVGPPSSSAAEAQANNRMLW
ncbi:hypothetical protein DM860_008252 [Cuscuta australis]|uniref:S-acyltransferase n=1 Tax=Cuscuta australis TaxID=267555 RepID=A0A328D2S1_9ASTE|nr:hypothetical protein DM860_008252 [Cuscuta australis]